MRWCASSARRSASRYGPFAGSGGVSPRGRSSSPGGSASYAPGETPVANPREVESIHWLTPAELAATPDLLVTNREFLEMVARGEIEGLGAGS